MDLFLPTLHTFENKNIFTGSHGLLRFKITPQVVMLTDKEVNNEESTMLVEFWHGIFCYEKSEIEGTKEFIMTEAGREEMYRWLLEQV